MVKVSIALGLRVTANDDYLCFRACIDSIKYYKSYIDEIVIVYSGQDSKLLDLIYELNSTFSLKLIRLEVSVNEDTRAQALNLIFRNVSACYTLILDSDDTLVKLTNTKCIFDSLCSRVADIFFFDYIRCYYFSSNNKRFLQHQTYVNTEFNLEKLYRSNIFPVGTYIFRTDLAREVEIPEKMVYMEDYYFLLSISFKKGVKIEKFDIPLLNYFIDAEKNHAIKYQNYLDFSTVKLKELKCDVWN